MTHLLVFLFVFSLLNCIRNGYLFYRRLMSPTPKAVRLGTSELILLGISISIVITCLFCGFVL